MFFLHEGSKASGTDDQRVGVALRLQRNNGVVRSANGPEWYMLWEIERK
jgi:hypothetical protein